METTKKNFLPLEAIHPSELIKDEIKARGMQKKELAERLGIKASNFSRLLSGKGSITSSIALRLEQALDIPAEYWMGLQLSYERDVKLISQRDKDTSEQHARKSLRKKRHMAAGVPVDKPVLQYC